LFIKIYFVEEGGIQNFTQDSKPQRSFGELGMDGKVVSSRKLKEMFIHSEWSSVFSEN